MAVKSFINEAGKRVIFVQSESDPFAFRIFIEDEPIEWLDYFNSIWEERANESLRERQN